MNRAQQILARNSDPAVVTGRLNVQDFVSARKAEIERLEASLGAAATQGKKRAFQTVPRRLRRRTASHNPERVPKRLRKRARMEASQDAAVAPRKKPDHGRLQHTPQPTDHTGIGTKASRPPGLRYAKRQKSVTWLPTHIWHTKRAHLETLWGYKVPVRPTLKFYRATHRISEELEAGMAWDTSYFATIIVEGDRGKLEQKVGQSFVNATKPIYTNGVKVWQGQLEEGPVLLYWQPACLVAHVHPELFETVWNLFDGFQRQDCRYSIGSIEVLGKRALSTLVASLRLHKSCDKSVETSWRSLALVGSVESLPRHSVLNLNICDPRGYVAHKQRPKGTVERAVDTLTSWLSTTAQLFDLETRRASVCSQQSLEEINKQRVAGTTLTIADPAIPVTLIALDGGRIRMLLPWAWVNPVWMTLMHSQLSVGGMKQQEQIAFERGVCSFPRDYPLTPAGQAWAAADRKVRYDAYFRRPAAKRVSYTQEIGDAFTCDWSLLGDQALNVSPVVVRTVLRGAPQDGARIYALPPDDYQDWLRTASQETAPSSLPSTPGPEFLIGFVTSGNFNLQTGTGTGVGSCLQSKGWCLVRNVGQTLCRLAKLEPAKMYF